MMVEIIHLAACEEMPEIPEDEPWLIVEASDDGKFFGTGSAFKATGEGVFYASPSDSDRSLKTAIEAARHWAIKYRIPRLWVQATPYKE